MFEQELTFAAEALAEGNLAACEIVCRDILDTDPRNFGALNLLGVVAAKVEAPEHAAAYFEAALKVEPGDQNLRRNLDFLKGKFSKKFAAQPPRYLVIKAWGFGFWSDVSHVLGCLLLAEIAGRIPVIHWGKNSLFGDGSARDAFQLYFEPVSEMALEDIARIENTTFFPAKWNRANLGDEDVAKWKGVGSRAGALYFLHRPETVAVSDFYIGVIHVLPWIPASHPLHGKPLEEAYRYLAKKYLRPQPRCQSASDAFFERNLRGAPFAAIHMRGSDKIHEDENLQANYQAFLPQIAAIDPAWRLFLLTDDEKILARMKAAYGERLVFTDCQRTSTSQGVHNLASADRVQAGLEVLTDTLIALRAARFVGNGQSNVSAMIAVLKDWKPGDCTLIGPSLLGQRNAFVYAMP